MTHKYNARPTTVDGIRFHSKKEAKRYQDLKLLERAGQIRNLTLQPRYPLDVNGKRVCTYVGDFKYFDLMKGRTIIEDVKGVRTREYILKRNLFQAVTGLEITET